MSVKIKLTTAIGGHKAGDTITVTPKVAEYLTDAGHVDQPKPRTTKKVEDKTTE